VDGGAIGVIASQGRTTPFELLPGIGRLGGVEVGSASASASASAARVAVRWSADAGSVSSSSPHNPAVPASATSLGVGSAVTGTSARTSSDGRTRPRRAAWGVTSAPRRGASNIVVGAGGGAAASGGQDGPRGIPAKIASMEPAASAIALAARRRASVGRPRAVAASAATTSARSGPSSSVSAATAASPAPAMSPVRQRASARSTRPSPSSASRPARVSSSARASASDPSRRCRRARARSGPRGIAAEALIRRAGGAGAPGRAGSAPARQRQAAGHRPARAPARRG
jgi:hypothetical protein